MHQTKYLWYHRLLTYLKYRETHIYVMYISEKYVKNIDMVLLRYQKHPTDALLIYF